MKVYVLMYFDFDLEYSRDITEIHKVFDSEEKAKKYLNGKPKLLSRKLHLEIHEVK